MSSRNIINVPASVRTKLLNRARESKRPFSELLQYFAMERFLYRLSTSVHAQKFVLKGALMFTVWEFAKHRATMDIGEYSGVQLKFDGELNKARIQMKIDIGFGDVVSPSPSLITYPTILQFPSPKLRGYTAETVIAGKFHTIVSRGIDNSRMKDFYDIWTLQRQMNFEGSSLLEAISKTFSNRQTKLDKDSINKLKLLGEAQDKARQWEQFVKKNQFDSKTPNLKAIVDAISLFLVPIVTAINEGTPPPDRWNLTNAWLN